MDRLSLEQSIVVAIMSGGLVILLAGVFEAFFKFSVTRELSSDSYQHDINLAIFVGVPVILFSLFLAIYYALRKKQITIDQVWENNRKSIVKYCLSLIDVDVSTMNWFFQKLESEGFDFNKDSDKLTVGIFRDIDYSSVKEDFDKFPLLQNALGFITYEQYMAIYDYLRYSMMFADLLEKQNYQKNFLELREKQAKKILELFSGEENNHEGLMEWKKHFSTTDRQQA